MRLGVVVTFVGLVGLAVVVLAADDDLSDQQMVSQSPVKAPNHVPASLFASVPGGQWEHLSEVGGRKTKVVTTAQPGDGGVTLISSVDGKPVRIRSFRIGPMGVERLSFGETGAMRVQPPMPWLPNSPPGAVVSWKGVLVENGKSIRAEAAVRMGITESIETPAGTFSAQRVDTSARAILEGRTQVQRSTAWFAPEVGLVREEAQASNLEAVLTLQKRPR